MLGLINCYHPIFQSFVSKICVFRDLMPWLFLATKFCESLDLLPDSSIFTRKTAILLQKLRFNANFYDFFWKKAETYGKYVLKMKKIAWHQMTNDAKKPR